MCNIDACKWLHWNLAMERRPREHYKPKICHIRFHKNPIHSMITGSRFCLPWDLHLVLSAATGQPLFKAYFRGHFHKRQSLEVFTFNPVPFPRSLPLFCLIPKLHHIPKWQSKWHYYNRVKGNMVPVVTVCISPYFAIKASHRIVDF